MGLMIREEIDGTVTVHQYDSTTKVSIHVSMPAGELVHRLPRDLGVEVHRFTSHIANIVRPVDAESVRAVIPDASVSDTVIVD